MTLTAKTTLSFTETKNGQATGKTFENTVQGYIDTVYATEVDGRLDVGVEEILDAEGDVIDFTPNKFCELPLEEQLERCIDVNSERFASRTSWVIAND